MKIVKKRNHSYTMYGKKEDLYLAEEFLKQNYKTVEVFKNTKRNYVAKIDIQGKYYILKSPRSEQILLQKKIFSYWKRGEALSTLVNVQHAIEKFHMTELVTPYVAIVKKTFYLKESYLIMEYVEGRPFQKEKDFLLLMTWIQTFHRKGFYHQDLNTSNVCIQNDTLRVFDTQAKRERISHYHRSYDILTLKQDLLVLEKNFPVETYYPLPKNFGSLLAKLVKYGKYNPISLYFRDKKQKKREK
ncbi:lipopolysaccharide core heptose(II) kinase RfaY [Fusobacterium necrophorum]|uniref:lipopolysaccharide core heptose(II) kinase RfaY n=1 Tax=Fusobacterium necrophorum TaxID=859 RepID=UPI003F9FF8AB